MVLSRKRERVNRKYSKPLERERQLSPGFLDDALDEDEEQYHDRCPSARCQYEEDFEAEARAENRFINAKKALAPKGIPRKSSISAAKPSRRAVDFSESEREESEFETEGEGAEESPQQIRYADSEPEYVDTEEEEEKEARDDGASEEVEEEQQTVKESRGNLKRREIASDEESPPRKPAAHRRMAVVYDSDED